MIPKDKMMHLSMGVGVCVVLVIVRHVTIGLGLLIGCATFGVFYELQQWYRKEGQPELLDALATAAPGILAFITLDIITWTR